MDKRPLNKTWPLIATNIDIRWMSPNGASTLFCVQSGEGSNTDMVGVSMLLCQCHVMMGIFFQFWQIRTQFDVHFCSALGSCWKAYDPTQTTTYNSILLVAVAYVESCSVAKALLLVHHCGNVTTDISLKTPEYCQIQRDLSGSDLISIAWTPPAKKSPTPQV